MVRQGTRVYLKIKPKIRRTCKVVFKWLSQKQKHSFRIPISLVKIPIKNLLKSKTCAKSIFRNINYLNKVIFDFYKIDFTGPAFADELVRQSRLINSALVINWVNCNKTTVNPLMNRALKRIV